MPIASTAHISCSAPLASRRNAERELRPDLGHTRASSRHVPRANQQERSTAARIFFSVQHAGRNGSVWSLPMLQAGCSRSRPVESSNSRRRAGPSRRFGGPRFAAPLTKCTILPFGILLHCNLGRDSWIARRRNTPSQLYGRRTEELRSVEFLFWGARRCR